MSDNMLEAVLTAAESEALESAFWATDTAHHIGYRAAAWKPGEDFYIVSVEFQGDTTTDNDFYMVLPAGDDFKAELDIEYIIDDTWHRVEREWK